LHALRLAVVVALLSWLGICGIALQVSHDLDGGERQRLALEHQHFQTQEVLTSIAATRSDLQDAETGQHGYLLTFDPVYLGAVERGSIASQGAIDHLAELTAGIPDLQRKVAQLRELAGRMLAELHQSVTLARNGERAAALAQIKSGSGRTLMDELRARLGDLEQDEIRLLAVHSANLQAAVDAGARARRQGGLIAALILLGAGIVVAALIRSWSRGRLLAVQLELAAKAEATAAQLAAVNVSLSRSEQRFRLLTSNIRNYAVFMLDTRGTVLTWNEGAERLQGYTAADMIGQTFACFHPPEEVAAGRPQLLLANATQTGRAEHSGWLVRKDGSRFMAECVISAVRGDDGRLIGFADITRDITLEYEAALRLKQEVAKTEAANLTKSQFLANMSHEIRTPMNAVLGLLDLLNHTAHSQQQREYINKAQMAARSLLQIIDDVLDFSKIEAGKMELELAPFRLQDVLHTLSVILSSSLEERDLEIVFRLDGSLPGVVVGDALRLQQVLLNLTSNAIKFTPAGTVILSVEALPSSPGHVAVKFSVTDTGIGIAADKLATIFDGFTQADSSTARRFGGTGLGLTISRRLVESMGGTLEVESIVASGSTFRFTVEFPLSGQLEAGPLIAPQHAPLRVLVVDDNPLARMALCHMVSDLGWRASAASSGQEALDLVQPGPAGQPPAFDAVLVDWRMPELDGWQTGERLRALWRGRTGPLLVLVTAYTRDVVRRHAAHERGPFDAFLSKPLTPSMLMDAVSRASKGALLELHPEGMRSPARALAGLRLLLVEDNPTNLQVAQELLTLHGARVDAADNGAVAVRLATGAAPPYDAVLMDVQMPVLDGYSATRLMRADSRLRDLPIVAMTANALPADRSMCLAVGMNDYLAKPIDMRLLVEKLGQLCGRRIAPAEAPEAADLAADWPLRAPGFDFAAALARMQHERGAWLRCARAASGDLVEQAAHLGSAAAAGDQLGVARDLHGIRGVAATVGASALAEWAAAQESLLWSAEPMIAAANLPVEVADRVALAVNVLRQAIQAAEAGMPAADRNAAAPFDPDQLRVALDELGTLIRTRNLGALDAFAPFSQTYAPQLGPRVHALGEAIERLNFVAAAEILRQLRAELNS